MNSFLFLFLFACVVQAIPNSGGNVGPGTFSELWPEYPTGIEWWMLNGKTADPCASKELLDGFNKKDCVGPEWPVPAVTVLLPSKLSVSTPIVDNFVNGLTALTITGKNMVGSAVTGASFLRLSTADRGCDVPDLNLPVVNAACLLTGSNTLPWCEGITFTIPPEWIAKYSDLQFESTPRKLCWSRTNAANEWRYTGFKVAVAWDCDSSVATKTCDLLPARTSADAALLGQKYLDLTLGELTLRQARTKCCRHTTVGNSPIQFSIGQCVNPNVTSCCQGASYAPSVASCCSESYEIVQYNTRPCPCKNETVGCPTGESCCSNTKYSEFSKLTANWPIILGQCYNTSKHRCCDTGFRYDPGQDQCCNITGIQSLNVPCPCNSHSDCQGGQSGNLQGFSYGVENGMYCCGAVAPSPYEVADQYVMNSATGKPYPRCSKYASYPEGSTSYQAQRCLGNCIDNRYQICCNGVACRKEFDSCCNSTCCNKYVGSCLMGIRPGTPNNKWNSVELDMRYEQCSTIEALNPIKGFWIYVWPAYLLLTTVVSSAFVIAYINKSSRRSFSFLERCMMIVAFATVIFACACFFAPVYKYGVWVVFVSLFTIMVACARLRWLNFALVIIQFITLLYLFDPFHGNNFFNFSSLRVASGDPDPQSAGIVYAVWKIFHSVKEVKEVRYCTDYYDYFSLDPQLQDVRRDNPVTPTFGYCNHGWVTALLIFEAITLMLSLSQFILDLIAFILRFKEERSYDPIELEVRGVDEVGPYYQQ